MIQITPQMRVLLAVEPVDFRKGIDGLVQVCRQKLQADPLAGALFVFSSRGRKSLKLLVYDGQGFWLCQKRLSEGRFKWWPQNAQQAVHDWRGISSNCCCGTAIPTTPKWLRCGGGLRRRAKTELSRKKSHLVLAFQDLSGYFGADGQRHSVSRAQLRKGRD